MEEELSNQSSQWNEQQTFSSLFFSLTGTCRGEQISQNLIGWRNALESKMSLLNGVSNADEIQKIIRLRKKMNVAACKLLKDTNEYNMYQKSKLGSLSGRPNQSELANTLFEVESEIDILANKKMPFLNVKRRADVKDL